ncbi:MAG TPA: biotin carboxylase N-terminal domain-containing protein [Candidatus Margulisiibacteriota bacterium]|nr:biotin carboxylase N-terminal domain-containing protein [Candidatus Margulisiibacteriota bacterium]
MKHFRKVLIANRGEIALRITRTCRAMGIGTAAIYADPDANAPFVRAADEAAYIGPPVTGSSFLAIEKIVEAARQVGVDAVHPGYGFLAENADFAQACGDAGITFIGPSPDAIRRMGSKIAAKGIAANAGVPTIPGFGAANLSDRDIAARARDVGYPLLIKASAGGGGKGMRIVHDAARLPGALEAARREAKSAFGDDTLLVERYFESPRHIEIQILGDTHGNLIHCFERECSIQRRYQKIIEEAPSPAVDPALRARMGAAAVAIGRAINYSNAGTVEFVVDRDGQFYFLEVNTRLQVEHPVTEETTGLDLVRLQMLIAQGAPLPLRQEDLRLDGHAIECRLYAEDPANDFLPSTGTVVCWQPAPAAGVRYESGVETGTEVTIHYDPMLAKIIAHGATRIEAAQRLARALDVLRVHGVRTNLSLLREILRHPEFLGGNLSTHFISDHIRLDPQRTAVEQVADRVHAVATALWMQAQRHARAPLLRGIPSGWRNNPSQMQSITFTSAAAMLRVDYRVHSQSHIDVQVDGTAHRAGIHAWDEGHIRFALDDVQRTCALVAQHGTYYVHSVLGSSELCEVPRFPPPAREEIRGGCRAPMPGKILAVRVTPGQAVNTGDTLVILEAMKMEHEVVAPHRATVQQVCVEDGQQVDADAVLVILEEIKDE